MTQWATANFVDVADGGLAADMHGISVSLLVRPEDFLVTWSMRIGGMATLPDVEDIADTCAQAIRTALERFDLTWEPEGG